MIYTKLETSQRIYAALYVSLSQEIGAIDWKFHRTISLMSYVTKLILRVIMARTKMKIQQEISDVQYSFVKDSWTRNSIFVWRMLRVRSIEMQHKLFICFIDYTKAFD